MKKKGLLIIVFLMGLAPIVFSQGDQVKYRRSSLHMVLVESETFPKKELVMKAWNNYPFPDKYNEHTVEAKLFDPSKYEVTAEDRAAAGMKEESKAAALAKSSASETSGGVVTGDNAEMPIKIEKFIKDSKIANQMVAKWFNRKADGTFDMTLIQERGFYDASQMDAEIAAGKARGLASLADAGEELLKNTFVVFSKLTFVENEPVARAIRESSKLAANKLKVPAAQAAAIKAADEAYEKMKEGYSVWTTSWLYQLDWNDSVAAVFYQDMWTSAPDEAKKKAFDETDLFTLKLVGSENAQSLVTFKIGETRTEEQIIDLATVRNIDNVFAKLQKAYDVFKPKVPVIMTDAGITAQIGMKEGLEGGEAFEVMELTMDSKTNRTVYKKVGKATVIKGQVWDNRYNAGEKPEPQLDEAGNPLPMVSITSFKGSKKVMTGMLLKQSK